MKICEDGRFWINLTNSKELSPSEADSHTDCQGIPCHLCNPKLHYRFHISPSLVPILSQMNPVHDFLPYFLKIHCNSIIFPSILSSFELFLPFWFSDQDFCMHFSFSHACYMPHPPHPP